MQHIIIYVYTYTACYNNECVGGRTTEEAWRKLAQMKNHACQTLKPCMESYGLTPQTMTAVTDKGTPVTLELCDVPSSSSSSSSSSEPEENVLFLLDQFGVSDAFYHELAQV